MSLIVYHTGYTQPAQDTIIASQYFTKADELLAQRKQDSAMVYFNKALVIYKKADAQKRIADCHDKISKTYKDSFDFIKALQHAEQAVSIRSTVFGSDHPEVAVLYNSIGHILKEQDKYLPAMEYYQKALAIQQGHFDKGDHHMADCYHNIGTIHHVLAEYDKALDNYKKALATRVNTFGKKHSKVADSYIDIGTTYYHLGKYHKALDYYQKALQIRLSIYGENSPEAGFCYNHIGNILSRLDKFDQAFEYQEKALSVLVPFFGEDHPNVALCYISIGVMNRRKGNHDIALHYDDMALIILVDKLGSSSITVSVVYNELGVAFGKKGFYDQSMMYYEKTLEIEKKVYPEKHPFIGTSFNNIGFIHYFKGEYDKAILYYNKCVANYLESLGAGHSAVARTYNNIANTYKKKENYNLALLYYGKAMQIRINTLGEDHSFTSYSYLDIGDLYRVKEDYDIALFYYQKALKIHKHVYGEFSYFICDTYNSIASLYTEQKEYSKALTLLQKSITIRLQIDGNHHPRTAKSYNQIADVYYKTKQYKEAIQYYEKARMANLKPNQESVSGDRLNSDQYLDLNVLLTTLYSNANVLQERFTAYKNIKDLKESIATYQKADALIQTIRQTLQTYQDKITFAKQAQEVYAGAIKAQVLQYQSDQNRQSLEQAFYYAEKSKANTLKGLLAESDARNYAGLPKAILDVEKNLKSERSVYTSSIVNERSAQAPDSAKIASYENELFDLSRKQDSLTQIIEKKYPKYYQLKHQNTIISVTDIQKKLDERTTLLEYFVTDDLLYVFTISKHDIKTTTLSVSKLNTSVEQLREGIVTKNTALFKTVAHQLYKQLILPVKNQLKGDQLIIIPDGSLWHLNFELLCAQKDSTNDPKRFSYLLREYAIGYASSINLLLAPSIETSQSQKQPECLAFSFSDMATMTDTSAMSLATLRDSDYDLPGTRKEIKAISSIIDGQYYFGSQAIESNFKKNADRYSILHLALHGEVDHEHPENSKLLFTKGKDFIEDNYLYSHELFALDIPAELTVLSACNTGSGKIAKGEGIMSLGNAFQYAGTKSLVLSGWEVSDQTTPVLMKSFYTNLKKGMNKTRALQQAKLEYLKTADINRGDPFYWGSFYLVGDPSPIPFKDNSLLYWVFGLGGLTIIFLGVLWYQEKRKKMRL
ncbi:CHAT domain-containing protein [Aquimarina sediminis]|uniref:CHAT domain-containing protein n=1 Tax=Aquimarina sediminis TaxID=2070536 RepID=UPI0013E8E247|nr:CHAT domain-containing protein [Aquimarina sediminis]